MPSITGRARSRAATAAMLVALVTLSYVAGLVTGVVGSSAPTSTSERSGVLDEAADRIAARAATPVDRAALNQAAVDGMLGTLGDRWSTYYGAADYASFSQSLEGRYTGVGVWVRESGGAVRVSSVTPGSPADDAGVRTGDVILAVDGNSTEDASIAAVASLLRGAPGTKAELALRRGDDRRNVTLDRSTVTTHDVTVDRVASDVTVVRVSAFTRGVGTQVRDAVSQAGSGAGVVLDLRGDPGGLLTEAVEVASAFLDGGRVVSYERRGSGTTRLDAVGSGNATVPLVVLVDGSTASAAEVVTGALQDRGRAVVVGSRTFGKGSVQEPSRLSDGSAIELTVGRYLTPKGTSIDGTGIEPDVLVDRTAGRGVAETRAIQVLTGLQASVGTSGRG